MTSHSFTVSLLVLLVVLSIVITAVPVFAADIPKTITLQGRLSDSSGTPRIGLHEFIFSIYDQPNGGNLLWSESQQINIQSGGIVNFELGRIVSFPSTMNWDRPYYLEIKVKNSSMTSYQTLSPRYNITSGGYVFSAKNLMPTSYPLNVSNISVGYVANEGNITNVNQIVGWNDLFLKGNAGETAPVYVGANQFSVYTNNNERLRISQDGSIDAYSNTLKNAIIWPASYDSRGGRNTLPSFFDTLYYATKRDSNIYVWVSRDPLSGSSIDGMFDIGGGFAEWSGVDLGNPVSINIVYPGPVYINDITIVFGFRNSQAIDYKIQVYHDNDNDGSYEYLTIADVTGNTKYQVSHPVNLWRVTEILIKVTRAGDEDLSGRLRIDQIQATSALYGKPTGQMLSVGGDTMYGDLRLSGPSTDLFVDGNVGIGTTGPKGKLDVAGGLSIGSYAGVNTPPSNGMIISGNVGIGKPDPSYTLDVNGPIRIGGNRMLITGFDTSGNFWINNGTETTAFMAFRQDPSSKKLSIATHSGLSYIDLSGKMRIDVGSGKVGIGKPDPSYTLDVNGPVRIGVSGGQYPSLIFDVDTSTQNNNAPIWIKTRGEGGSAWLTNYIQNWGGGYYWQFGSPDVPRNVMSLTGDYNGATLFVNGSVGIGTTGPTEKLHISGGQGRVQLSGTDPGIWFDDDVGGKNRFFGQHDSNGIAFWSNTAGWWAKFTDSGEVGIGTTNPQAKLDVTGEVKASSYKENGVTVARCPPKRVMVLESTPGADEWIEYYSCERTATGVKLTDPVICDNVGDYGDCKYIKSSNWQADRICNEFGLHTVSHTASSYNDEYYEASGLDLAQPERDITYWHRRGSFNFDRIDYVICN